ncbi:hypothetical protein MKZ12_07275 [Paenibacillus sp. FSL R5-0713]|uniref:hypothetical protein n=1 Tax=Paenibacillus sp. FSL R5-0713 TaxID=2921655 RepID=UPI0030D83912
MTKVNVQPEGQTNGDQMTQFTEVAWKKSATYSFDMKQDHFYLLNQGNEVVEVKVGGQTRTIDPGESWGEELEYNSFSVKALTDDDDRGAQFHAIATVYGIPGIDRIKGLQDDFNNANK